MLIMQREIFSPQRNPMHGLHLPTFGAFGHKIPPQKVLCFPPRDRWGEADLIKIPLAPYIERFIGEPHRHRVNELQDAYVLFVSSGNGYVHGHRIFRDCSFTIVLARKEGQYPLACIGFNVSRLRNMLTVGQIQGVSMEHWGEKRNKHITRYLLPLQWEQMLLTLVRDYAHEEGFRLIRVIPARKQAYYGRERAPKKETFIRRYEATPRALGFTKSLFGYHVYPLHP
ncbi:MAG: hypothetical protein A2845_04885 [Candidatus Lloydbacteria bacterium RIFCSPHIGHO2_01_FULL_49_22]|uniref:Uncharacterized protein n=1 Tax=Candidatus Lloydbacteria bacterium RIFCSPHIGHO2_01_FULL_49_22 TaxID=1798658 RepID=A0A1G2CWP5_9BACT|nr:MAG: hypothetical protein A2845_04885 [Candidatus Lloydbacteria bacterium RIFCSPHIGHO2_01_FULL_49_22]OGZ10146.1 MAG: hypothetical protein A3C14_00920 [Candidatus Lloydbacteria bacterium RIFCSPHIGHO2_02_FULL_50_18]